VERAEAELARWGCRAAHYPLTGEVVERVCCIHLAGAAQWRVIAGFPSATEVAVLMIGRHDERSVLNVYRQLYVALGIGDPPGGERDKPVCCEDNAVPPEYGPVGERLEAAARRYRRARRNRRG
jgi:hypothetical protein